MEENKKGKIDFLSLLCLAAIAIITIGFFVGAMIRWQKTEIIKESKLNAEYTESTIEENTVEENTVTEKQEPDYNNKLVENEKYIYSVETYTYKYTSGGIEDEKKISLPCININSTDALKLNKEFKSYFDKAQESLTTVEEDGYVYVHFDYMDYNYNIYNDELLSLDVRTGTYYVDSDAILPEEIYNFNIKSGKLLTNEEVIDVLGLTKEEFKKIIDTELEEIYQRENSYSELNYSLEEFFDKVEYDIDKINIYYEYDNAFTIIGIKYPTDLDGSQQIFIKI